MPKRFFWSVFASMLHFCGWEVIMLRVFYDHNISVGTTAILYKSRGTHSLSRIWLFSCQYHSMWWLEHQRRNNTWITKLQFTHVIGGGGRLETKSWITSKSPAPYLHITLTALTIVYIRKTIWRKFCNFFGCSQLGLRQETKNWQEDHICVHTRFTSCNKLIFCCPCA
jgi:hypothetical protein